MGGRLLEHAQEYGAWRLAVRERIIEFADWLRANDLFDAPMRSRFDRLLEQIGNDRITIVVVGEFSRGKSELINAIFADDFGGRLLPAYPGRSTMCPTELRWDANRPPCIRLLPIETRATDRSLHDFRNDPTAWTTLPIDPSDSVGMVETLQHICQTLRVPVADAYRYDLPEGFADKSDDSEGTVEVPRWRHAIVNIPHPLLEQGLVILDTPGLNAIGNEPELTLSLLPNAQALLFVLALDTGLSETDVNVWRQHLAPTSGHEDACFAVLNKIDTLWDGLRTEDEIAHYVRSQAKHVSDVLGLSLNQILPMSAQKGLVAKVIGDEKLLASSGLPLLEKALATRILPAKHRITSKIIRGEIAALLATTRAVLETRIGAIQHQLSELYVTREGKVDMGRSLLERAHRDKIEFEAKLTDFQEMRSALTELANELFRHLGTDTLDAEMRSALTNMTQSNFTAGIRRAMRNYLQDLQRNLETSIKIVSDIHEMMAEVYSKHGTALGLRLPKPPTLSLDKPVRRMARVEQTFKRRFDTASTMLTYEQMSLTRRFFKTVAAEVRDIYMGANLEATFWLRAMISPIESQIAERQSQLRRHVWAVKRLRDATEELKDRITDLEHCQRGIAVQLDCLQAIAVEIEVTLSADAHPLPQAA